MSKFSKKYVKKIKRKILIALCSVATLSVMLAVATMTDFSVQLNKVNSFFKIGDSVSSTAAQQEDTSEITEEALTLNSRASQVMAKSQNSEINAVQADDGLNDEAKTEESNIGKVSLNSIAEMASTAYTGHALYADGHVVSWGTNNYGLLGNGNTAAATYASGETAVIDSNNQTIMDGQGLAAGEQFTMVLRRDGTVWAWGRNNYGQLGNRSTTTGLTPKAQQVKQSNGDVLENIVKVEAGVYSSYALDADGTVWSWGYNGNGRLGIGNTTNQTKGAVKVLMEDGTELSNVKDIQAADSFCLAITNDNKVYAWGANCCGEFGNGTTDDAYYPIELTNITDWKKISARYHNIGFLKNDGTLWTSGAYYSIGYVVGEETNSLTFNKVKTNETTYLTNIKDFEYSAHSLYVTIYDNKYLYYCGDHDDTRYLSPIKNMDGTYFEKDIMKMFRQSYDTDFFAGTDGIIYAYGYNDHGEMYKWDKVERYYISIVGEATERIRTERMLVGETVNLGLTSGDLYKGINLYNLDIDSQNFVYTMYDTDIATISQTGDVTAKKSGIAKGVVTDTKTGYSMEIAIIVEDTYGQIEIGANNGYLLCEDGSVHSWGMNYYGAWGDGSSTYTNWNDSYARRNTTLHRVKIDANTYLANIVKIAPGDHGCLALDKDGNVWGWGINDFGQLGFKNNTYQTYAKLIYSGEDAVDISTNRWGSAIVLKDGSLYTAGNNRYGQLANSSVSGNTGNVMSFTLAEGYEKIVKVQISEITMTALKIDGTLWTVGTGARTETLSDKTVKNFPTYIHGDGVKRTESDIVTLPVKANLGNIVDFVVRGNIVLAKTANKDLYTWGIYQTDYNETTALSTYVEYKDYTKVASNIDKFSATWSAGYFTREKETGVYSFGTNYYGELGREHKDKNNPLEIGKITDADGREVTHKVLKLGNSRTNTFTYIAENGNTYGCGYNDMYFMGKTERNNYEYITPVYGNERIRLDRILIGDSIDLDITVDDLYEGFNIYTTKDSVFTYEIYPEYQSIATINNEGIVTGLSEGRARGKIRDIANDFEVELVIEVEKNYAKVEKSSRGAFALDTNGNVWYWGKDYQGLSGNGKTVNTNYNSAPSIISPTRVLNANDPTGYLTNIIDISATTDHAIALDKDGNVWSWGRNNHGELGTGRTTTYSKAQQVMINSTTPLTGVVKIEAGCNSSIAIAKDGSLYTWGWADEGGLLNGVKTPNWLYATPVNSIDKVIDIKPNGWGRTSLFLRSTGTVWTGIYDSDAVEGTIENGPITALNPNVTEENYTLPQRVDNLYDVEKMALGYTAAAVVKKDGTVWTWGNYSFYDENGEQYGEQLVETTTILTPVQVQGLSNVDKIAANSSPAFLAIMKGDNKVYSWGDNVWGECGVGYTSRKVGNISPTSVSNLGVVKTITGKDLDATRIDKIFTTPSDSTTYLVLDDGRIMAYGFASNNATYCFQDKYDDGYQYCYDYATYVGREYINSTQRQEMISIGEGLEITGEAMTSINLYCQDPITGTLQLKSDNESIARIEGTKVIGVGVGETTITGFDPVTELEVIVKLYVKNPNAVTVPQVELGQYFTVALREDGTVWVSGINTNSELGLGWTGGNIYEQAQVLTQITDDYGEIVDVPLTNIIKISASYNHVLALAKDGTVYAWGQNANGQLGINSKVKSNYAVNVLNSDGSDILKDIIDISAGGECSIFLDKDGNVLTCGKSSNGKLGNGLTNTTQILIPKYIGIDNVIDIDAGTIQNEQCFVLALQSDKRLCAWGYNGHGELGDGSLTNRATPEEVHSGVISIEANARNSLIKTDDGRYLITGSNVDAQFASEDIEYATIFSPFSTKLEDGSTINAKKIELLAWGIAIIDDQGKVYARGWNEPGTMATLDNESHYYTWKLMKKKDGTPITNVWSIARGGADWNSAVIARDGTVWMTGDNSEGQIGNRNYDNTNYLTPFGVGYINLDKRNITIKANQSVPVNLLESEPDFSVFTKDTRFNFEWSSVDNEIATVSQSGLITGKSVGKTMITVSAKNTGISSSLIVSVTTDNPTSIAMPQVENGERFTVVLKADGTVWTTGLNNYGQLGSGNTTKRNYYDRVKVSKNAYLENVVKISAGYSTCLALTADGEVYAWGRNNGGLIGINSTSSYYTYAMKVKGINNKGYLSDIVDVSIGYYNAVAVNKNGDVIVWGQNTCGQLGRGNTTGYKYPVYSSIGNAISAEAGYYDMTILRDNRDLYQAGNYQHIGVAGATENVSMPTKVMENVVQYQCPVHDTMVMTGDKKIYGWGWNWDEALPFGSNVKLDDAGNVYSNTPTEIAVPVDTDGNKLDIKYVNSSDNAIFMQTRDGYAYACGYNDFGIVSNGTIDKQTELKPMLNSKNEPFKNILMLGRGKYYDTSLITKDGYIYTTGENPNGEFGNSTNTSSSYLTIAGTAFLDYENEKLIKLLVSENYNLDVSKFYINGDFNVFPELNGLPGDIEMELEETDIISLDENGKIIALKPGVARIKVTESISDLETYITVKVSDKNIQLKQGYYFTLGLKSDGTVWGWGYNNYGELGIGNRTTQRVPVQTLNLKDIVDIGVGDYHSVAVDKNGRVYTWGYNYNGQLGNGNTANQLVPVVVQQLHDIVEVEAYGNTTYAIDKLGRLYVWGAGFSRTPQLYNVGEKILTGEGPMLITQSKYVYELSAKKYNWSVCDVIQVVKGNNHYLALGADGLVYAWGNNAYGQLGRGFASNRTYGVDGVYLPDGSDYIKDIVAIEAGNGSSIAVDKNGKVYTWGYNGYYQLADKTKTNKTLPVEIDYMSDIEGVSQSNSHCSMVYDRDGYVYSAGYGGNWQLGTNSNKNSVRFNMIGDVQLSSELDRVAVEEGSDVDLNIALSNTFNLKTDVASTENIDVIIVDEEVATLNGGKVHGNRQGKTLAVARHKSSSIHKYIQIDVVKKDCFTAAKLENGRDFSIALKADGTVWSWGSNQYGQLGLGNNNYYTEPQRVQVIDPKTKQELKVVDISVGEYHVVALAENGITYSWGKSDLYQTGHGTKTAVKKPTQMYDAWGNDCWGIVKVMVHDNSTYMIDIYGGIYACGKWNTSKIKSNISPVDAPIDATNYYIVDVDGKVWDWGSNGTPELVVPEQMKAVDEGTEHHTFLGKSGKVYSIGSNDYGELGNGTVNSLTGHVATVKLDADTVLENIVEVKSGDYYNVAVAKDGSVYTWGSNDDNKQGRDDFKYSRFAQKNPVIENAMTASTGYNHTTYADKDGIVYAMGRGDWGQLGNKETNNYSKPVVVGDYFVNLNTNTIQVAVGEAATLEGWVDNFNILYDTTGKVTYSNQDSSIIKTTSAKENLNGNYETLVTGRKVGTTSIIAKQSSGNAIGVVQVEVIPEDTEIKPQVSVGGSHTVSLRVDGSVWTWGQNTYGQLGTNDTISRDDPVKVVFDNNVKIKAVSAGKDYSLALDTNGNVWGWGKNTYYEIGQVNQTKVLKPRMITKNVNIVKISAGANTSVMIADDGTIYTYGLNSDGQAGTGDYTSKVANRANYDCLNVIDISAGNAHVMALKADGTVWVTGSNAYGQLGDNNKAVKQVNIYQKVELPETIVYIEAGENSCFAISNTGNVYAWGQNNYGQLGVADKQNRYEPQKIDTLSNIREISSGINHTIARDGNGYIYVSGTNKQGELGTGNNDPKIAYDRINTINTIMDISAGQNYSVVALKDGSVWGWGDYNHGDPDLKSKTKGNVPVRIGSDNVSLAELEVTLKVNEQKLLDVNGEFVFNLIYDTQNSNDFMYESLNNDIAMVDRNGYMTGVKKGTTWVKAVDINNNRTLVAIVKVIGEDNVVAPKVEAGNNFAVALRADGSVWSWGYNGQGQLGNGTMETSNVPTKTTASGVYTDIKSGERFTLALRDDGTVWGFGANSKGQLASTNISYNNRAMQIKGLTDITQIAAGRDFGLALDSYGILYGWGENAAGQLGQDNIGEYTYNVVRVPIATERIVHIAAGYDQSAVVDSSGKVYGFGSFFNGYLDGIENAVKTEIGRDYILILTTDGVVFRYDVNGLNRVGTSSDIIDISVQDRENMYQTIDEKVYVWGTNTDGSLGNGTSTTVDVPVLANKYSSNVFGVGAGYRNTYVISDDGFVYASGTNELGSLGNASEVSSLEHTLVSDTDFEVSPDNGIMHIGDTEEIEIIEELFNVFRDETKDISNFELVSDNASVVTAGIDDSGSEPVAKLEALSVGTANITVTDKMTGIKKTIIRIVEPIEQDRIDFIKADGVLAKVVGEKKYEVTIPTADNTASLEVQTKDKTDAIDIGQVGVFAPNGNVTKVVDVNDKETIVMVDVKATNGEVVTFEVKIIKLSTNNDLMTVKVDGKEITPNSDGVYQLIVEDKEKYEVYAKAAVDTSEVSIAGVKYELIEQTEDVSFIEGEKVRYVAINVRAESGDVKAYRLELYKKDAKELTYLDKVMVNGELAYQIADDRYYAIIRDTDTSATIEAFTKFYTSSVQIDGNGFKVSYNTYVKHISDLETEVTIVVKDENGNSKNYTLIIVKDTIAKQELQLEFVRVNGVAATISEDNDRVYEFTFDKPVNLASIEAGTVLDDANVSINGGAYKLKVATENVTIIGSYMQIPIIAEREDITTLYYLNIYGLPDETDIKRVTLQGVGDATYNFVTGQFEISVTKDITQYIVEAEPVDQLATTKIEDDDYVVGNSTKTIDKVDGETITRVKIYCKSQSGLVEKEFILEIKEKSSNTNLNAVMVNGENASFDEDLGMYYAEVSGATDLATVKVLPEDDNVGIEIDTVVENPHDITISDRETIVKIKVTAEDGTEKVHDLKIVRLDNNVASSVEAGPTEAELTALTPGDDGNYYIKVPRIDSYVVRVTVPSNAELSINGDVETTGTETIALEEDVTNVMYSVTAEDGTEVTRTIVIEKESDNTELKSITGEHILSSKLAGENMYEIKLDDLVTGEFEVTLETKHALASVKLNSEDETGYGINKVTKTVDLANCVGTDEDGNEILTFMVDVMAEDGSVTTYTVVINRIHNLALEKVVVNDVEAVKNGNIYDVTIPRSDDEKIIVTALNEDVVITLYDDGLALGQNPGVLEIDTKLLVEEKTYMIMVKDPEDDTRNEVYTLNVRKQSNKAELEKVAVDGNIIVADENGVYKATVKNLEKHTLELVSSEHSVIKVDSEAYGTTNTETKEYEINVLDTKTVIVKVKAEDGTESTEYVVEIYVMDNEKEFEVTVDGTAVTDYDEATKTYTVEVDNTKVDAVIGMIAKSNKAVVSIDGETDNSNSITKTKALLGQGKTTRFTLTITSEDGESEVRYLEITQLPNSVMIDNITVNNTLAAQVDDDTFEVTVGDKTGFADTIITALDNSSYIIVDDDEDGKAQGVKTDRREIENNDKITVPIKVLAEDGRYKDYELVINVISSNTDVFEITVDDEEVTELGDNEYRYFIATDATTANVHVQADDEAAKVVYGENSFDQVMDTVVNLTGEITEVKFKVVAEDGSETESVLYIYKISVDNSLFKLWVDGNEVTSDDGVNYRVSVKDTVENVTVKAESTNEFANVKVGTNAATVHVSEVTQALASTKETIVRIDVIAQSGEVKSYYLVVEKLSTDSKLAKLEVDGVVITPDVNGVYNASVSVNVTTANVVATASSELATVKIDTNSNKAVLSTTVNTNKSENTYTITVVAEDGSSKDYTLKIAKKTEITGKIITENVLGEFVSEVTIYRSDDTRVIDDPVDPREVIAKVTTEPDGTFRIPMYLKGELNVDDTDGNGVPDVLEKTYDVVVTKKGYLSYTVTGVGLKEGNESVINEYKLLAGDVVVSDQIEIDDMVLLNDNYGVVITDDNRASIGHVDLNEDGTIDGLDRDILKKNYTKKAEVVAWVDPNPVMKKSMAKAGGLVGSATTADVMPEFDGEFILPIACDYVVTSEYGERVHPITKKVSKHTGIDLAGEHHTEVFTIADGEVTFAGSFGGFGNCVEIKHVVNGETIYSFYAHLSRIDVAAGNVVTQGQVIGLEGGDPATDPNVGYSTGHHLHFEIRCESGYGNDVDPNGYFEFTR